MPAEAQATSELAKALVVFFLEGLGATAIILMPGYLLGVAFARGLRGPAPSERAWVANAIAGAIVVHAVALAWTLPLARRVARDGPTPHAELTAWALVLLLVLLMAGAVLAPLAEARSPAGGWGCCGGLGSPRRPAPPRRGTGCSASASPPTCGCGSRTAGWCWAGTAAPPWPPRTPAFGTCTCRSSGPPNATGSVRRTRPAGGVWLAGGEIVSVDFFAGTPPTQHP
jgi:hypothetical protein